MIVQGTAGLPSAKLVAWRLFSIVAGLIVVVMIASGVDSTVCGSGPVSAMFAIPHS